ncbi:MAG TPA: hypothetical protein VN767_05120 [Streptosporangiaceae bacterium]|jgi:hypothetical protein|nr:hypothetical protein [Streptosporangiaceae bacterium]
MRFYRITFVGGLAIGYVLGAQAGRERYEQLKQLARKAAESPAMQQTAGALQAQATATAKTAKEKATTGVRNSASKVTKRATSGRSSRTTARSGKASGSGSDNGASPRTAGDGNRPFVPANGTYGEHGPL